MQLHWRESFIGVMSVSFYVRVHSTNENNAITTDLLFYVPST